MIRPRRSGEHRDGRTAQKPGNLRDRPLVLAFPSGRSNNEWGRTQFLTRKLAGVSALMSLNVLAYNLKRVMKIIGAYGLMQALMA
ncbi:hypothetical protein SAMN05660659_04565 [Pseudomonas sp. LAMO17WK12:I6]|jgi:hypothetical protein|uniref:hypothetical protein n=1 Tax=Pseudomonas TaxID=286 RepID=UPI000BD7B13D|nr:MULTISPECIES: hypothetical protein [unclassified Pseudomonas]MBB6157534.1 hypothetical protein [Pseudomonas sp. JAI115]SNY41996.1 hypothetical protein SAMN05660659_04565 [Pseudomonas sp. LAMO17WK12:I6]SNY44028.1 hypothetical protein SAMN05660455_05032 [Pseudomonas sp. LAMO17WK12:I5]